jgi:putative endonuclease
MKLAHNYYVYIVECFDKSYYIGITNNLERRLFEHNEGIDRNCYTYERRPVSLKYFEQFTDVLQAIAREKQLKGWSRKKKKALIDENYELLKQLSKSTVQHPSTSSG